MSHAQVTQFDASAEELMRWILETTEQRIGELPAFPVVAARLVDVLEQPGARIEEVEEIISRDPAIASRVIQVANSALFGGACPVEDVGQAVVRLGFRETAGIAIAVASRSLYDMEDRAELEAYPTLWAACWHDALVCAYGARLLARELGCGQPERTFLGGMFRHVGGLLILKILSHALVHGRLDERPPETDVEAAFRALHPTLGANYLRASQLPDYVVEAAHRNVLPQPLPVTPDTLDQHVVRFAGGLCDRIGVAPFARGELGPAGEQSREALDVDDERLELFELQFRELGDQVRSLG